MGVVVSSSHIVSVAPSSSGGGLLTLFPCSSMGPSHERQFSTNFSNMSPSHGLQFFTKCPTVGPSHAVQSFRNRLLQRGSPQGHKPCQQTCSSVGFSLHRVTGPARSLLQLSLPTGSQPSLRTSLCSGVGYSTDCMWISAPPSTSMGCRGTACLTMVFIMGCRGISASAPGVPPPPPSSLTMVSAEFSLLSPATKLCDAGLFFLLNMLSQRHYHHC